MHAGGEDDGPKDNDARREGEAFGLDLVLKGARERLTPTLMTALATGFVFLPVLVLVVWILLQRSHAYFLDLEVYRIGDRSLTDTVIGANVPQPSRVSGS